jgi:uncharacterized membrane-anchored protein
MFTNKRFPWLPVMLAILVLLAGSRTARSAANVMTGPGTAHLEKIAQVDVPAGYIFADGNATRAFLKKSGEPTSGKEFGLLMPTNGGWSVMFDYDPIGYVKDDEKDKLDPDKILESIRRGTAEANKERQRNGIAPLEVVGWDQPPKYDPVTHNLEWAIRGRSEGRDILNYKTRFLGRKGVMGVVLIVEPESLPETLPTFRNLLATYSFQTGQNYAEYRPGDKVAKYGLAALIVGGAAVGAAKLGLFAWLAVFLKKGWKLVVVAFAAVVTGIKKFFGKLFGRKPDSGTVQ